VSGRPCEDSADSLARDLLMSPTSAKHALSARSILRRRSTGILRTGAGRAQVMAASGAAAGDAGLDGVGPPPARTTHALRKSDTYAAPSSSSGAASALYGSANSGLWSKAAKASASDNRKRLLPQPTVVDWRVESSEPQMGQDADEDADAGGDGDGEEERGGGYPLKQRRGGAVNGRDVDKSEPSQWVVWDMWD
jgi:hypothetical protein